MEKLEYNLHQPTVLSHLFLIWNLDIYPVIVYRVTESPSVIFLHPAQHPIWNFWLEKVSGGSQVREMFSLFGLPACLTDTIDQANSYLEYH